MVIKTDITSYHYLVVDDDAFMSTLIADMLHKVGADKVDIAENGEVALAHIGAGKQMPEIIICDLSMPGEAFLTWCNGRKAGLQCGITEKLPNFL